jgi:ATP-dependent DNA ligase
MNSTPALSRALAMVASSPIGGEAAEPRFPPGPDWIHEIKHDGYRLIVHRDGARVRLLTRNGNDWTKRYPLIVKAALAWLHRAIRN